MGKGRRKRHTPEQIVKLLREAEAMAAAGKTVGQIVQALGVSEPTYYRWRSQYGEMSVPQARKLQELQRENEQLKRLLAEAELDKRMLKELVEGNW